MRGSTFIPLLALMLAPLNAQDATTFALDAGASHVVVHVDKSGLLSFAGHTHEVALPVASGSVMVDSSDLSHSTVHLVFDATSFKVTGRGEPADDVPDVQRTMESAAVLDVSRFPRVTFESHAIEVLGRHGDRVNLRITGDLMLHGVTKPATTEVSATVAAGRLTATGMLKVKQSDFGIEPVTAGAGTVRVKDEVTVEFTLVARP